MTPCVCKLCTNFTLSSLDKEKKKVTHNGVGAGGWKRNMRAQIIQQEKAEA